MIDIIQIDFSKGTVLKRMGFIEIEEPDEDKYQLVKKICIFSTDKYSLKDGKHQMHYYDSNGAKGLIPVSKSLFKYFSQENRLYRALLNLKSN